jgi:NADH-quinone oxidoreductase subunit J
MLPQLLAATDITVRELVVCRTFWGIVLAALSLGLLVPQRIRHGKTVGGLLLIVAAGLLGSDLPLLSNWIAQSIFWVVALVTLGSAVGTISAQSPVHAAIWFAMSLLGTAGLFFMQGAQFLGVATVIVYAGAIVVTFLFVIMLAQPEGHATYDRITWGWYPKTFSVLAAAAMVGILTMLLSGLRDQALAGPSVASATTTGKETATQSREERANEAAEVTAITDGTATPSSNPVLIPDHMAGLGGYLFSRHLVSIELAGTLLLAALVGAVAIAMFGKPASKIEEALR